MGKLLQTFRFGQEDWGFKFHLNEAGVFNIKNDEPSIVLLGAGVQANLGFVILGTEINSRTRFNDMSMGTDPLWLTPSLHFRTPFQVNAMLGVDISLSANRAGNSPRALEPYRIFGGVAISLDMLAKKRNAELARKQKDAQEKAALEYRSAQSAKEVKVLTAQSINDSLVLANEKKDGLMQRDSMQKQADIQAMKSTADSIALIQAAGDLAEEVEKRSDAEKQLLSTGALLLDAVYFKTGKTIISINSKPYLNIIGKMLLKYPKLQIEVAGHTDNVGGINYNITLSQGRAESVRSYLTQAEPGLLSNLNAHGYGMSMPKADNSTSEGRLSNRRVELRVLNTEALREYSQR
jgi:outer membrane protein OmpA-like peptidoglycan-associated protein